MINSKSTSLYDTFNVKLYSFYSSNYILKRRAYTKMVFTEVKLLSSFEFFCCSLSKNRSRLLKNQQLV